MRIVTEEICRISDVFEPYTPITFAALQDVGKIICYRATHNNRTVYKLSNKITNIERPTEEADV